MTVRQKFVLRFALTVLAGGLLFAPRPPIALADSHAFTPQQTETIRGIVREYLVTNPEVILEAIEVLKTRDQADKETRVQRTLAARRADLLEDPGSPVTGNVKGDVTVVEFFDYRCPYCKKVHPTVQTLLQQDKNIRFIYKEWPILGPQSVFAARAALAARNQKKYAEFHATLMEIRGSVDEASVFQVAKSAGLDIEALKRDIEAEAAQVEAIFARNGDLARGLDIAGTPAFVIGDVVLRGAVDLATMRKIIADVRRR